MNAREAHQTLPARDGYPMETYAWHGNAQARFAVQIAHGMGEHSTRYRRLADAVTASGGVVYANEHRGHGAAAEARGELGDFGQRGFATLVDDMADLSRHVHAQHPGLPLILMGHSMGSFAAQLYILDHSELIAGVALSGTTALDLLSVGLSAGWTLEDANAAFDNPRTPFDWLSRDPAEVDAYIADPLCGFTVKPESFASMAQAGARTADAAALARIRADLPLFAFVGDRDPINNGVEWFDPLMARYRKAGLKNVSSHVYGGARHEVFNETNRGEVTSNFLAWIEQVLA